MVLTLQDIGVEDGDVFEIFEFSLCDMSKDFVKFDGNYTAGTTSQLFGQRTGAAADLEDDIIRADSGGGDKKSHKIQIDEEMLTETTIRGDAGRGEKLLDLMFSLH